MSDGKRDVERLIEDGLIRYGGGDLAGALAAWERALIQDPGNLQAIGYVDYVRRVVDLVSKPTRDELVVPFGLGHGDAPEYQIELAPEPPDDDAVQPSGALQDGWAIAQDDDRDTVERLYSEPPGTLDLEYDEVDEAKAAAHALGKPTKDFGDIRTSQDVAVHEHVDLDAFDGPEQELSSGFLASASVTPGFGDDPPSTPGFSSGEQGNATGLRQPQLGFVQPRRPTTERARGSARLAPEPPAAADEAKPGGRQRPSATGPVAPSSSPRAVVSTVVRGVTREPLPPNVAPSVIDPAVLARETLEVPDPSEVYDNLEMAPFIEELPPSAEVSEPAPPPPGTRPRVETFTRNLGLAGRYQTRDERFGEESPTRELPRHQPEDEDERTKAWRNPPVVAVAKADALEALAAEILPIVERDAPAGEAREARLRRRLGALIDLAGEWSQVGDLRRAVVAADLALAEEPESVLAQKLVQRNRDTLAGIFQSFLGSLDRRPSLARSLDELGSAPLGARAAFLLSRVDGNLTYDEILDVSGMPRLEAYRYLCQLLIRGILSAE